MPEVKFTPMAPPAVPKPAVPQFPMPPPPPPVKAPGANILLMAILVLAGFLAGGLVVFLLMRR